MVRVASRGVMVVRELAVRLSADCLIWRSKGRHQIGIFLSIKILAILTWQNHQSINKQELVHLFYQLVLNLNQSDK